MKIFLILFILYTQTLLANVKWDTTVSLEDVANSPQWLRLLHYQPAWTTEYKSLLDGEDFFFAKDGKTNPLAELKASLEAMSQNLQVGKLKQHPQCAFPRGRRGTGDSRAPS